MKYLICKWMGNDKNKWLELYSLYDLNYDCDSRKELVKYNKKYNQKISRLKFICDVKKHTFELYRIALNVKNH